MAFHRCEELFHLEGLAEAQGPEALGSNLLLVRGGQQHGRGPGELGPQGVENHLAVHARHRVVDDHDRRPLTPRREDRLVTTTGLEHIVPFGAQDAPQRFPKRGIIIDDENGPPHDRPTLTRDRGPRELPSREGHQNHSMGAIWAP